MLEILVFKKDKTLNYFYYLLLLFTTIIKIIITIFIVIVFIMVIIHGNYATINILFMTDVKYYKIGYKKSN